MIRLVLLRLASVLPMLLVVTAVTFFLGEVANSDPARIIAGDDATPEQVDSLRADLGLDESALARYGEWLSGAISGDFGESLYSGTEVSKIMASAIPVTMSLTAGGVIISLLIGLPFGVISGMRPRGAIDRTTGVGATIGQAIPNFWLGMVLVFIFALELGWLPATGYVGPTTSVAEWLRSIALPSIALGVAGAASISRQTRSALIGAMQQEYVRTAVAKGLPRRTVVLKHALKNAATPVVTVLAFLIAQMLSGSIVIERIFAMTGMGTVAINAVLKRDPDVIMAVVTFSALVVLLSSVLLDTSYAWLNPKVRVT